MPRPILFKLVDHASGIAGVNASSPLTPAMPLPRGLTPFGKTDANIKQAPLKLPIVFFLQSRLQRILRPRTRPLPAAYLRIFGFTRDSTGVALASCAVKLFRTADNAFITSTTSDATGFYEFGQGAEVSPSFTYYVVAYKAGSPDTAGTTLNTLMGQ